MPEYITPTELAKHLRVSRSAVHQWLENGRIPASFVLRVTPKVVRIRVEILKHFAEMNGATPDDAA